MAKDLIKIYNERQVKENFVPIDEEDIAHAVDIPVKEIKLEFIEKSSQKKPKKQAKRKSTSKKNWIEKFKIPGPEKLPPKGYILIITEKPQASIKIANALTDSAVVKKGASGVYYYEIEKDNKKIIVACAVGHLFTLAEVSKTYNAPSFNIKWAPNFLIRKGDFTKKYYDTLAKLCKKASEIIVATDYDIEGEVIGMNIVKYICNQKDAQRMKFSTLTQNELKQSYTNRSNTLNWHQGIAGETRHYIDWIYGINISRALMDAVKSAGRFRLISIGRVQGPTLNLLVKKELEIKAFNPEKYWQVFLEITDGKNTLEVKHIKDLKKQKDLEKFKELKGKKGKAKTEKSQHKVIPPAPFDLTSLQTEAYRHHRITPSNTLRAAQNLYLAGLISYPRTSSQKLPPEIGYNKIIKKIAKIFNLESSVTRKKPIEGKKSDPAHPSIYPTGEFQKLSGDDEKIFNLIAKRFISCFTDDAVLDDKKITAEIETLKFAAKGVTITKKGWMAVYPSNLKESELGDIEENIEVKNVKIEEKLTQPPKRYTPASIVSELEKKNLGTKATRSSIIETLYDRGYIKERSIEATTLGISMISTLEKNCPTIIEEQLTRDIEKRLENIRSSKSPLEKEKEILKDTEKVMSTIWEQFQKNKLNIGKDLIKATEKLWEEQKKDNQLMQCPVCKRGSLTIKYTKKYNRFFVACDNYPECKTTYTLPPNSLIKRTDKQCEFCKFSILMSIRKGKRPWFFCFNPDCPSKK